MDGGGAVLAASQEGLGVAEWAGIVGAAFAAIAAVAALVTVRQTHRMLKAALTPSLQDITIQDPEIKWPLLEVHNTGGAVALGVRILWAHAGKFVEGDFVSGLATGEHATAVAAMPKDRLNESRGVILWQDDRGNRYASSLDSHYKTWPKRWGRREVPVPNGRDVFEQFYGESVEGLEKAKWQLARPVSAAHFIRSFELDEDPDSDPQRAVS